MRRSDGYPWRLFFLLLGGGLIGAVAVIPYAFALSAAALRDVPVPLPVLALAVGSKYYFRWGGRGDWLAGFWQTRVGSSCSEGVAIRRRESLYTANVWNLRNLASRAFRFSPAR